MFVVALTAVGYGQSVVITSKKVTYTRPKPIEDYKKTFTINYPKVKASTPALSKKIEAAISYSTVLGLKLKEELGEYQWLEEADYDVGYNKKGILSITLSMDGSGAYPSGTSKNIVVDVKTGLRLKPADVFKNLYGLLAMVKKAKAKEVSDSIVEIKKDPENTDFDPEGLFKESDKYNKVTLDEFSVDDKGVTFIHNYGFPHVAKALEPSGGFTYT